MTQTVNYVIVTYHNVSFQRNHQHVLPHRMALLAGAEDDRWTIWPIDAAQR